MFSPNLNGAGETELFFLIPRLPLGLHSTAVILHWHIYIYFFFNVLFLVGDTPWNVSISGPDEAFAGRLSTFTCLMTCTLNVDCTVRWPFEGGFPLGSYISVHEDQLLWIPTVPGTFQNLTCLVENVAAGRSAKATKMVAVKGNSCSSVVVNYRDMTSDFVKNESFFLLVCRRSSFRILFGGLLWPNRGRAA